jgi:hypothetical protein
MRIVAVVVALLPASLGLVACGSSGSVNGGGASPGTSVTSGGAGSVTSRGAGSINGGQVAWCAFHVWRLERDLRSHHIGWAAFNAALATHHCTHIKR